MLFGFLELEADELSFLLVFVMAVPFEVSLKQMSEFLSPGILTSFKNLRNSREI